MNIAGDTFFFNFIFTCVCIQVCNYPRRREEGVKSPELELTVVVSLQTWVLGTDADPLRERQMLLTPEPSLGTFSCHSGFRTHPALLARIGETGC